MKVVAFSGIVFEIIETAESLRTMCIISLMPYTATSPYCFPADTWPASPDVRCHHKRMQDKMLSILSILYFLSLKISSVPIQQNSSSVDVWAVWNILVEDLALIFYFFLVPGSAIRRKFFADQTGKRFESKHGKESSLFSIMTISNLLFP